jgi:hypothetical protein
VYDVALDIGNIRGGGKVEQGIPDPDAHPPFIAEILVYRHRYGVLESLFVISTSVGRTPRVNFIPSDTIPLYRLGTFTRRSLPGKAKKKSPPLFTIVEPSRFIGGSPMNPATNSFAGWSYTSSGVPIC